MWKKSMLSAMPFSRWAGETFSSSMRRHTDGGLWRISSSILFERRLNVMNDTDMLRSIPQLETAIRQFVYTCNEDLKPLVWTKTADEILETKRPTKRREVL